MLVCTVAYLCSYGSQYSGFGIPSFSFDVECNLQIWASNHRIIEDFRIASNVVDFLFFSICKSHRGSLRRAISRGVGVSAGATVWSSSQMSNHALDVRCHRCHMLSPMVLWMPCEHVTKPTLLTLPGTGMCSVISEYCGHGPLSTSSFWH